MGDAMVDIHDGPPLIEDCEKDQKG